MEECTVVLSGGFCPVGKFFGHPNLSIQRSQKYLRFVNLATAGKAMAGLGAVEAVRGTGIARRFRGSEAVLLPFRIPAVKTTTGNQLRTANSRSLDAQRKGETWSKTVIASED